MNRIDRRAMARAFGTAADTYDAAAALQNTVRSELLTRVGELQLDPQVVIDLGAGTGAATPLLKARYPQALIAAVDLSPIMLRRAAARIGWLDRHLPWRRRRYDCVAADAGQLPFADGSVELIFSSLMLQWCDDLDATLAEIRRVLSPNGVFIFSSFGPTTLHELRSAWFAVDQYPHVNEFVDVHDLGAALGRAGFVEPVLDVDRLTSHYTDVNALLRSLKAIGARNALDQRNRGLTGKAAYAAMCRAYAALVGSATDIPATWEVVYACCFGSSARAQRTTPSVNSGAGQAGEVLVPISRLRKR